MGSIEDAADKLSEMSDRSTDLKEKFSGIDTIQTGPSVKEDFLSSKIEKVEPVSVAGIDGGVLKKRYSSGDLVAVRAVSAVFGFDDGLNASYLPSRNPEPEFQVFSPENRESIDARAENLRLEAEIKAAGDSLKVAEKVFMDGSIVPGRLQDDKVLDKYNEILGSADNGQLVGVVEDSYGLKLSKMLEDRLDIEIGKVRDTILMDSILQEGERSFVRKYSDSPVEHPVLGKLDQQLVNRIHTFYVKLSDRDLPLRIDFLGNEEDADKIAGMLLSLKTSDNYTIPSPIIEADRRAKIPETYVKRFEKRFSPRLKRRERRY